MKKILVPEGMLEAFVHEWKRIQGSDPAMMYTETAKKLLESILHWLSENLPVLTVEQAREHILAACAEGSNTYMMLPLDIGSRFLRRMFLAPDPPILTYADLLASLKKCQELGVKPNVIVSREVPEEIKDLLHVGAKGLDIDSDFNHAVIEAYIRGKGIR